MRPFARLAGSTFAVAACPAVAPASAETSATTRGAPLRVCLLERNLPYSERSKAGGFDAAVAAAVAAQTGHAFVPVWVESHENIQDIDDSDLPTGRLARGACDAIFSMPGPAAETLRGNDRLRFGAPYYGAAFEILACKPDVPGDLRALRGREVAIQSQTVAHFALLTVKAEPRNYFSLRDAFAALLEGTVDAGLLWGPTVGWQLRLGQASGLALRDPAFAACSFVAGYEPPQALRWNLHVATRSESSRLRERIDTALADLAATGELEKLALGWGIPWHPPFDGTYSLGALDELRR